MEIIKMLAPVNGSGARSGRKRTGLVGVTIHNTDNFNEGAGAINHGKYLQNGGSTKQASWHYAVDDASIVQSIPEEEVAWHAGDGTGNGNYQTIAIEICVNPDSDLTKATDNAATLVADILKRYGLKASALFQHNHWSGKNCPSQIRQGKPYSWETFCKKVSEQYGVQPETNVSKQESEKNIGYTGGSIVDYLNSVGQDSSFASRKILASQHGIQGYSGTASQNTQLLNALRGTKKTENTNNESVIAREASKYGMKVASQLPVGSHFWLSENATIYGGSDYGVAIPQSIKKATTMYLSLGQREDHGCLWVLAKELMSWVKVSECLIK